MHVESIWAHNVEIEGQEASWASKIGPGDIKGDLECQSDGNGDQTDGIWGREDSATSAPCCDLKEVETDVLAEEGMNQHEQCWDTICKWRTQATHTTSLLSIIDNPPTTQIHHIDMDTSNYNLDSEKSVM